MILSQRRRDVGPLRPFASQFQRALTLTLLIILAGVAHAVEPPTAATPPAPTAPGGVLAEPAQAMSMMADQLERDADFVLATAAGRTITKGDVADAIRAMPVSLAGLGYKALFTRAMDQLLREKLGAATAQKEGLEKDPVLIRRQKAAADRLLADTWLEHAADAAVTERALRARYDREVAGKAGPEEVRARIILVPTEAEAKTLIEKLHGGADFADLAREYSKDFSAARGGDVGYVPLDAVSPEVGGVMFALSPGQLTAFPVRALPGYFIVRIEARRQRATPTFDEARPVLANELRREAAAEAVRSLTSDIKLQDNGMGQGGSAAPNDAAARPAQR